MANRGWPLIGLNHALLLNRQGGGIQRIEGTTVEIGKVECQAAVRGEPIAVGVGSRVGHVARVPRSALLHCF